MWVLPLEATSDRGPRARLRGTLPHCGGCLRPVYLPPLRVASAIRCRAAALMSDRFGVASLEIRTAAQRFRCAAAIRSLAAALRFRFAGDPLVTTAAVRTRPA